MSLDEDGVPSIHTKQYCIAMLLVKCVDVQLPLVVKWHDHGERVGCRRYWFCDIGKERVPILLFYIVWRVDKYIQL